MATIQSPLKLAEYIIRFACDNGYPVTNLALQKLLYFMQYVSLIKSGEPICSKMIFEAWKHGPVVREVYYRYSINGGCLIYPDESLTDTEYQEIRKDLAVFQNFLQKWIMFNPWRLVDISHKKDGAWDQIYRKSPNKIIPLELLKATDMKVELEIL